MQLTAGAWPMREETLKKLYCCCDHNGRVPVFAGQACPDFLVGERITPIVFRDDRAVMFQHTRFAKNTSVDVSCLFNDTGIGNGHDYPVQPMHQSVLEGKCHAGARLPSSCWDRQAKNTGRGFGTLHTSFVSLMAQRI